MPMSSERFTPDEMRFGNCTKPVTKSHVQLDTMELVDPSDFSEGLLYVSVLGLAAVEPDPTRVCSLPHIGANFLGPWVSEHPQTQSP